LNKPVLDADDFRLFQDYIYSFYSQYGRHDMPWRLTDNPYYIFISEVMLQQTQVDRVWNKYTEFIKRFPDVESLASVSLKEVMPYWQGLGYNRRALYLHQSAQRIMDEFNGRIPSTVDELQSLPGIGCATASSICAFAYNSPIVFIETNIRSVYIHFFFNDSQCVHDGVLRPFIEKTLDRANPRGWYYALMDYGAALKKSVGNPGRRSVHYTRQTPFKGSLRQVRGSIIRYLTENGTISYEEVYINVVSSRETIDSVLKQLEKEGFIVVTDKTLSLA
jgi:A/G-specific adenine glycosylase